GSLRQEFFLENTIMVPRPRVPLICFALAAAVFFVLPQNIHAKQFTTANMTQLAAAINEARPGDQILMTDGIWNDAIIDFNSDATSQKHVTLRAVHFGKVLLTGKSRL